MTARILVVDDQTVVVRSCMRILSGPEYQVDVAKDGYEALRKIEETTYDIIILDIMMPGIDGLEVLARVKETHPDIDVIMVTGLPQIDVTVKSMKLGAFDYLAKPFDPNELRLVVQRALAQRRLARDNVDCEIELGSNYRFENIIGSSAQMQNVFRLIAKCAPNNSTILLTGESGTGKKLIARAIHYNSLRKDKPFVPVDCTSLSEDPLEIELFGHLAGASSEAASSKKGMFEVADAGTLFLDEIGNISLAMQAKLLHVLQEREFRAVGDTRTRPANFRLVTATSKDLDAMIAAGTFRDDLYCRINSVPIHIPALRERRDDIAVLSLHFLKLSSAELGRKAPEISEDAMGMLLNHAWPGNVRELENTIRRAVILSTDAVIRQAHLVDIVDSLSRPAVDAPRAGKELKPVATAVRARSVEETE